MNNAQLKEWNDKFPVGTSVVLTQEDGQFINTRIESPARLYDGGPRVFLEGVSGDWSINNIGVYDVELD